MASPAGIELQHITPQTTTTQPTHPDAYTTTAATTITTATQTQNRRKLSLRNAIMLAVALIFLLFVFALLIIHLVIDVGGMKARVLDVQDLDVKHTVLTNTSVAFKANATLGVKFKTTGDVNPTPGLAVLNLTLLAFNNTPISTFANTSYYISEKTEQVLVVHFEPHVNLLPEEEVWGLDKWLAEEYPQIVLTVKFYWKLKNEELLVVPSPPRHADFTCSLPYARNRAMARKYFPLRCKRVVNV